MSAYSFDVVYRPGKFNAAADTLSRTQCNNVTPILPLKTIHERLGHPGTTRLLHYIKTKNLPYSVEEVREVCRSCYDCAVVKPRFYNAPPSHVVKATQPFERLSMDFIGPKQSVTRNKYLLVLVDEYSRFPFAFPTKDMTESTVISCLDQLFHIFGVPAAIHSDRGSQFMGKELKAYLLDRGISQSWTTPYNPAGNGQCERTNGTLWKTIQLTLKSKKLRSEQWEYVVSDAMCALRTLLCTATNCTPHERMFNYARRTMTGKALPSWLIEADRVYAKRHVRTKGDPLGEEVTLLDVNSQYAFVEYPNGRQTTLSIKDLAPLPPENESERENLTENNDMEIEQSQQNQFDQSNQLDKSEEPNSTGEDFTLTDNTENQWKTVSRNSNRKRTKPNRYIYESWE